MGCCCSKEDEPGCQEGEVNERTHLLGNPVSNSTPVQRVGQNDDFGRYPNSLPKRTDEQSALNKILQQTATNVIDVAALDSHNLEQHEYLERSRLYAERGQTAQTSLANKYAKLLKPNPYILKDLPGAASILAKEPIPSEDIDMIRNSSERMRRALHEVRVEHKEDLVVPFGIP